MDEKTTICCISDCHLGYMHRLKRERLADYEKAFNEALEKAKRYDPGLYVFGGDIFHSPRPDPQSFRLLLRSLLEIAERAQVVICVGNHEIEGNIATAYIPLFSDLHENISVLSTENPYICLELGGKTIGVHGFQYLRSRDLAEQTLRRVATTPRRKADYDILCIHQGIEGYIKQFELSMDCMKQSQERFDLIITGHIHENVRVKELSTPSYYVGSTERASFNEFDKATGFLVFRDFDFQAPEHVTVRSSPMNRISEDIGVRTPEEVNSHVRELIEKNRGMKCLQITLHVDVDGNYFDINHEWEKLYPDFTILEVNIPPRIKEEAFTLEKTRIDPRVIEEYFEKSGLSGRRDLLDVCTDCFERYGK